VHLLDGRPVYSAGDLVGFLACEHLTDLERAALAGFTTRPVRNDPELDLIRRRGFEHERRYRDDLEAAGRQVTEIQPDAYEVGPEGAHDGHGEELRRQAEQTIEAIRRGDDVIYQAAFFDGRWRGHADFLLRVDGPGNESELGPYHYQISDTKLAHRTKASALIQLCTYVDLLTPIQGRAPDQVHVALGGSARLVESHRVADYLAYYRALKARFEATVAERVEGYPPSATYPDPVEHCDVCRWVLVCRDRWRHDDHLSLVAGISRNQRRGLTERDVTTRRGLAVLALPVSPPLPNTSRESVARVREQARIQVEGEDAGRVLYELLPPERLEDGTVIPGRGLAALPPPSPGDLFFDIEGDPFAFDDGLEYLFGVIEPGYRDEQQVATDEPPAESADEEAQPTLWSQPGSAPALSEPAFHHQWALDPAEEKLAFEWFIDLVRERRRLDPSLHVYHFGSYERGRIARLSTRHATREEEVDALLRAGTFVDLFNVVRQGLRASVESYSIKRLEPLYGFQRSVELQLAGESIVEFERFLEEGGRDRSILETIRQYNRDDCLSTLQLRDWLEQRRPEAETGFELTLPRPGPADGAPSDVQAAAQAEVQALADRLTEGIPDDEEARTPDDQARLLLANLLDWHRREAKSGWWRFFDLMSRPDDELELAREPIAGLSFVSETPPSGRQKNPIRRYSFPPQENELEHDKQVHDPRLLGISGLGGVGRIVAIDQMLGHAAPVFELVFIEPEALA
jgi:predicted RecB family nuclease